MQKQNVQDRIWERDDKAHEVTPQSVETGKLKVYSGLAHSEGTLCLNGWNQDMHRSKTLRKKKQERSPLWKLKIEE